MNIEYFKNPDVSLGDKIKTAIALHLTPDAKDKDLLERKEPSEPDIINIGCYGGIFLRGQYYNEAGNWHKGHKHNTDHLSYIASGSVSVHVEGEEKGIFYKGQMIEISAEHNHQIIALEPETMVLCIFAEEDVSTIEN